MSFLIDTNVISEVRKGVRCNESVWRWWSTLSDEDIFFSVLTIGEILKGIESIRRRDTRTAIALAEWLSQLITKHGERVIPIDIDIATEWGRLGIPNPLPVIDGLLAATARVHDLVLATRNVRDIARAGVETINPWLP